MKIYFIWCTYPTHAVFHGDPVGLVSLSGIAKSLGHQTDISLYRYDDGRKSLKIIQEKIAKNRYDIIGVSSNSVEKPLAFELATRIDGDFVKICGGLGPTLEPEEFQKYFDYIFIGEGEKALAEFLKLSANKQKINIQGIYSKDDKGPFSPTELTENLDTLPLPDYEFKFGPDGVPRKFLRTDMGIYMGAKGCPSACKFCFNAAFVKIFKGRYFRLKSAEKVCQEIRTMKKINPSIKAWNILDDTFMAWPVDSIKKISAEWRSMNTPFDIAARVIDIKPEKMKILVENGLRSFNVGLERATPELRNFCNKPYFSNETLFEAMKIVKDCRAPNFTLNNMCGFPDETRNTLMQLIRLNIKIGNFFYGSRTKFATVLYPLRLLPGSPWYNEYRSSIKNIDPITDRLIPNIKVDSINEEELKDWVRFFSSYIAFLVDFINRDLQKVILDDIERYGPSLTQKRIKLLKELLKKTHTDKGSFVRFILITWLKIRFPVLFPTSFFFKYLSKIYDKFFNN